VTVLYPTVQRLLKLPMALRMTPRMTLWVAATLLLSAAPLRAQGAFPPPVPAQSAPPNASPFPPVGSGGAAFPPVNGAAPSSFPAAGAAPAGGFGAGAGGFGGMPSPQAGAPPADCMKNFLPLRQDAEKKAGLIKAAGARKAPPEEACKLIASFAAAEIKMISFIETNSRKCGIPPEIGKQMKDGHANTEKMRTTVCNVAQQRAQGGGPAAPSLSEALGSSAAIPEAQSAKRGGATFETLNGNALTR
jgi:hypothetical protein